MAKKKASKVRSRIFLYITAILLGIVFIFPFYYLIINSLKSLYVSQSILPQGLHWENFYYAVTLVPFFNQLKNSFLLILYNSIPVLIFNIIMGFAFARLKAPGKNFVFMLLLSTIMLPGVATQIPQYLLFNRLGLRNTFWIWTLNAIGGSAVYIFLYRQFFANIPKELEEAARIDGCSTLRMLLKVFMPLAKPVIVIVTFQDFFSIWSDFMGPFMFLNMEKWPLSTALMGAYYSFPGEAVHRNMDSVVNAASILLILPVIVAFAFSQKYLVEGISTSGIKG